MSRQSLLIAVALLVAGCSYLESPPSTTEPPTTVGEPGIATTSPSETTTLEDSPCLLGDHPFVNNGLVSAFGGANGDATQISSVRWNNHAGCEQVVVDLLTTDGAPARSIDPVGVEYDASSGVIRVSLPPAIVRSAVADSLVDGVLVTRTFVVSTAAGLMLDVHLAAGRGYAVRAYELDSPSRIVIDIQEDDDTTPVLGTRIGNSVVIVSPPAGPVGRSFVLRGYVKGAYGTVIADLVPLGADEPVASQQADIELDRNLWAEFTMTFRDVPEAELELIVAPDGSDQDATSLPLDTSTPAVADAPEV